MFGAAESSKRGLELGDFRTVDELAMAHHARDRLVDGLAEPPALRGEVDERNGLRTRELVHDALRRWS